MKTINIKNCEGYLWWSDQQIPQVYQDEALDICLDETKNPFVVEGQLYDRECRQSYSIKYVDGQYLIIIYNVAERDFANPDNEQKDFLSNRMGDRRLKFLRYWEEKEDENCIGMPVLTFTKNVFVGFKEKEESL
jgi:CRISPR type III-associated protein (TIGR04423 family)